MRIIAGTKRGTKLFGFDTEDDGQRPTLDHVKEAIFDKIQFQVPNAMVLDLFGGTGSLGLECISRGAKEVVIVEKEKTSLEIIRKNCAKLGFSPIIQQGDYDLCLKRMGEKQFDLIFLDPPYNSHYGEKALSRIVQLKRLTDDGVIVFEHHKKSKFQVPEGLEIVDEKTYGLVVVSYLKNKKNDL